MSKISRHFTEEEISEFTDFPVFMESLGSGRWTEHMSTVFHHEEDDKFYRVEWEQGLTENQENSYYNQPVEVFPVRKVSATDEIVYSENKDANLSLNINVDDVNSAVLIVDKADKNIEKLKEFNIDNVTSFLDEIEPILLNKTDSAFLAASQDFFKALKSLQEEL